MAGYGSRTAPAEGKQHDLMIRVLTLEDAAGRRGVVLSSDTLGIPQSMYNDVCALLKSRYGLDRSQIMLNASHTHCGPVLEGALRDIYPVNNEPSIDAQIANPMSHHCENKINFSARSITPFRSSR